MSTKKPVGLPDEKVPCKLVGINGNAFVIMGAVSRALKKAGKEELIDRFIEEAMSGDYDHLLRTAMAYTYEPDEE